MLLLLDWVNSKNDKKSFSVSKCGSCAIIMSDTAAKRGLEGVDDGNCSRHQDQSV